jgi:hypothetical protein
MSNAAFKLDAEKARELKLEQLLAMSNRIGNAIATDIEALEGGKFDALSTGDPEIEKLCLIYGREVTALKASGGIKGAPAPLLAALKESGARLKSLLKRHGLLVGAMRHASEGIVQAVAEEVEKTRARKAPYGAKPEAPRGKPGAIVYNRVV